MLDGFKAEPLRGALRAALSPSARGAVRGLMLIIHSFIVETISLLRADIVVVAKHDPDLARQMRRAASSIALNTAEGSGSRGRNAQARFHSALGSAKETLSCLEVAAALGYLAPPSPEIRDRIDRIIGTLTRLAWPRAKRRAR